MLFQFCKKFLAPYNPPVPLGLQVFSQVFWVDEKSFFISWKSREKFPRLGCRHPVLGKIVEIFEFQGFNMLTLWIGPFWVDDFFFSFFAKKLYWKQNNLETADFLETVLAILVLFSVKVILTTVFQNLKPLVRKNLVFEEMAEMIDFSYLLKC